MDGLRRWAPTTRRYPLRVALRTTPKLRVPRPRATTGVTIRPMAPRSRFWLQSAGYQLERAKADKYERIVGPLTEYPEIKAAMKDVNQALASTFLCFIPAPRYDAVYAGLHEVRTRLCGVLPAAQLSFWVVEDIEGDISYLNSAAARDRANEDLKHIRSALIRLLGPAAWTVSLAVLRAQLGGLSESVGYARESVWLKVNLKRSRLALMGLLLMCVIIAGILQLPTIAGRSASSVSSVSFFLALALAGAGGGLVSSLLSPEPVDAKPTDFYVNRGLLYVRPLVGATVALASYFAVQVGILSVVNIKATSPTGGFLVLGFISGFSERFFVNRVVKPISKSGGGSKP